MTAAEDVKETNALNLPGVSRENPFSIMEICGTHTMAIAASGIKQLLADHIRLISGPGCPVCVTAPEDIDALLALTGEKKVTLCAYGDLLKIPGSKRGTSLMRMKSKDGAHVRMVYSAMDAVEYAAENPKEEVVFAGIGFETTAPGTAAAVLSAADRKIKNFSVFSLLKLTPPALDAILTSKDSRIDALICPGHVAVITGYGLFDDIAKKYGIPAVVAGFDTNAVARAVHVLASMKADGRTGCENLYRSVVKPGGNTSAAECMRRVFEPADAVWRGMGMLPGSGLKFRGEYSAFDAETRFSALQNRKADTGQSGCSCAKILQGIMQPEDCPMFGKSCTPEDPAGPCMVSQEGACAAAYRYEADPGG